MVGKIEKFRRKLTLNYYRVIIFNILLVLSLSTRETNNNVYRLSFLRSEVQVKLSNQFES